MTRHRGWLALVGVLAIVDAAAAAETLLDGT